MKKRVVLYDLALPLWMLWLMPMTWFVVFPVKFMVDFFVIVLTMKSLKIPDIRRNSKLVIFRVWIMGIAAEIIGTSAIYVISEMRRNDDWWEKVCDAIWKHPSNNFCAFGIITICIVLVAFCIFLFNYKWCLEKADFDDIQRKKVALSLAVFTAPYWFYLPTEWFY